MKKFSVILLQIQQIRAQDSGELTAPESSPFVLTLINPLCTLLNAIKRFVELGGGVDDALV